MRIKIKRVGRGPNTDDTAKIGYVTYDEIGIRQYIDIRIVDNMGIFDIVDEKLFFLAVIKYGIIFEVVKE
jgi:hypothetical protein